VKSALDVRRQLEFIVTATEYLFERPVRSVLDVGAGEGNWRAVLKRLRPRATYYGVDPSEYAVRRFGRRRNIQLGGFADVGQLDLPDDFDIVLCCGVVNYVPPSELARGLRALTGLSAGTAYFEVFTDADDAVGDFTRAQARSPRWWRGLFRRTGWHPLGLHLYVRSEMASIAAALERGK
jgi:SAM-dependent methyltransferase